MIRRIALLFLFVWLAGCGPDLETDEGIKAALTDPTLPSVEAMKAVEKVKGMPVDRQNVFTADLVALYGTNRAPAGLFAMLVQLRDPAAKSVYAAVLRDRNADIRQRAKAAIALGDIQATDLVDDMSTVFRRMANEDLRRSILAAFAAMPDAGQFPLVIEILNQYDPDREPIAYHAYACEIVEAAANPPESVARAAVYGMFLDNATNQNVYKECSLAVLNSGPSATEELLTVLEGNHAKINARFAKFPTFIKGNNQVKAADTLGLLRDKKASAALLRILSTKPEIPPGYRDNKLIAWASTRIKLFVYAAGALGDIGDVSAVPVLARFVVQDKKVLEPFTDLIGYDPRSRHDLALGAIDALNAIGDPSALPHLKRAIRKGDIPELKGFKAEFVYQARWEAARAYARLGGPDQLAEYKELMEAEKVPGMKKKMAEFLPMLEVAKECGDQVACYGRHLKGADKLKAEKAAWQLGRMPRGGGAEGELLASLGTADLTLRKAVIKSLFRVGTKKTADKVTAQLAREKNRRAPEYKDVHFKMRALRAHARNNG
jgi:HEAT repeat protein